MNVSRVIKTFLAVVTRSGVVEADVGEAGPGQVQVLQAAIRRLTCLSSEAFVPKKYI